MSDRLDLRTIKLLQLANELTRKYSNPAMDEAYSRIRLAILSDGLPTNQRDLRALEREINAIFIDVTNKHFGDMTDELYKLSALEATFAASITKEAIKREGLAVKISETAKQKVDRYVKGSVMHLHSKYSDFVGAYEEALIDMIDGQSKRVKAIIKGAWLQQSNGTMPSPNSVISQVKAVSDIKGKQVAESLVRTAVNHFSTQGRLAFRDDNVDVIDREVPIVTFDSRVSETCISISVRYGIKGWPVGQSPVGYPPYHFNAVAEGELIDTAEGMKAIQAVSIGDLVLTHRGRYKRVTAIMRKRNETNSVRVLKLESGREIRVTDEHPLLSSTCGWVRADVIKVGDNLFEKATKGVKLTNGASIVKVNPYNYPSIFDGDEVFSEVIFEGAAMPSSVNLNQDFVLCEGKVSDSIVNWELMNIVGKSNSIEPVDHGFLSTHDVDSMSLGLPAHKRFISSIVMQWVATLHPLGMSAEEIAIGFVETVAPVILSNTNPIGELDNLRLLDSFASAHGFNLMNSAPSTHSSICKTELSLDCSKCFSLCEMMVVQKLGEVGFISKFNHDLSTSIVESISIVEHNGYVYNLEVDEDHSYCINGVVSHNCRTNMGFLVKGQKELYGTRQAIGGQKGKAAEEEFDARKSRTDRVVKYRGKKDSGYFKAGQIPANKPVAAWLNEQPPWFVEEVLGKKKAQAFMSGDLNLAKIVDRNLKPLTLEQIGIE